MKKLIMVIALVLLTTAVWADLFIGIEEDYVVLEYDPNFNVSSDADWNRKIQIKEKEINGVWTQPVLEDYLDILEIYVEALWESVGELGIVGNMYDDGEITISFFGQYILEDDEIWSDMTIRSKSFDYNISNSMLYGILREGV